MAGEQQTVADIVTRQYLYDGIKAIPLQSLPPEAWTIHGADADTSDLAQRYAAVAFLYRAIEVRANTLSGLPWAVLRNEKELWTHEDPTVPANLRMFADLPDLLWQTEAAFCLHSEAFWHQERNTIRAVGLRWLQPDSMKAKWTRDGLSHFERRIGSQVKDLPVEDVVYVWLRGMSETKPRPAPAVAALSAANVIANTDKFSASFFERGAIKATILGVPATTQKEARQELEAWYKRFMTGISNAWAGKVINSDAITPVQIGEGVSELSDSNLTKEKR